ncbi:MAG: replication initiator protein [Arizlama microvirus]|nr:MAG: replication initiator protein [Arizlama microvirus]
MECRIKKSREWAIRCTHELITAEIGCFITLTFNDENLDPIGSLRKRDMQLFWKKLRKKIQPTKLRYFHGAEYSPEGRPHHHAIIFGYDFPDKIFLKTSRSGFPIWTSETLDSVWTNSKNESLGFAIIQDISYDACSYVAKYTQKKITGNLAKQHYKIIDDYGNEQQRLPEYGSMSRRPHGIGYDWYKKYAQTDWLQNDKIAISDKIKVSPPRYYDKRLDIDQSDLLKSLKVTRQQNSKTKTSYELRARNKIILSKLKNK